MHSLARSGNSDTQLDEIYRGPQGIQGVPGIDGNNGKDGKDCDTNKVISDIKEILINDDNFISKCKGDKGDKGESIEGKQGYRGEKGLKGDKGDTIVGPQGPKGDQGETGVGIRGDKGDYGDTVIYRGMFYGHENFKCQFDGYYCTRIILIEDYNSMGEQKEHKIMIEKEYIIDNRNYSIIGNYINELSIMNLTKKNASYKIYLLGFKL